MADERRSYGALCMCDSTTLDEALPKVCLGLGLGFVSRQWWYTHHLNFYYGIFLVKAIVKARAPSIQHQEHEFSTTAQSDYHPTITRIGTLWCCETFEACPPFGRCEECFHRD